jgi:hypothetical protein
VRTHRNKLELHLQEVAVHELLSRTLQIVGHEIKLKQLTVSTNLTATADRLSGDPARYSRPITGGSSHHHPDAPFCARVRACDDHPTGCSRCFGT